jgi:hypothetical protein
MNTSSISSGDRRAFYEQLTADNAAVLLVDHQIGLFTGVVDFDVLTLKHNASPLANELYTALDMPFATLVGQIFAANAK